MPSFGQKSFLSAYIELWVISPNFGYSVMEDTEVLDPTALPSPSPAGNISYLLLPTIFEMSIIIPPLPVII